MGTTVTRGVLLLAGLAAGVYGAVLLLQLDFSRLLSTVIWLAGGVVAHDFVFAPVVVVLGVLLARVLPDAARRPVAVAVVVWGTVTVAAIPVLSGQGGKPDNATLLDRPYWTAWLVLTALVLVATAVASVLASRRAARRPRT
ncbi:hypothetical protein [Solicola sp. PLA-1-18]|uniref:hypothetical protein n=1 Tax=Solicola sp. PLA-1-18 TaxID=3380532 RepID=UPI003B7C4491